MRYATVTLRWTDGASHPVDTLFAGADDVRIDAIQYVNPGPDGQFVELLALRGDLARAEELLADADSVLEFDVVGSDGTGVAYVQCRTVGAVDDLLATLYEHEIVLDWPMRFLDDGARELAVTVYGTSRAIQDAAAALPATVEFRLERMGEYEPSGRELAGALTDRQREILDLAIESGYYEVPRETTHRELAAKLDLSAGTVSEHLQRIEAKLVRAYTATR